MSSPQSKRMLFFILLFSGGFLIFSLMNLFEERFVNWASTRLDIFGFLNTFIVWNSIKLVSLGLAIGVVAIPVSYLISHILYLELSVERRFGRGIYLLSSETKLSFVDIIKHSYILFAPTIILTRIFSELASKEILDIYLIVGEYIRANLWFLFLVLTLPYIILDASRVRSFNKKKLLLGPPSKLLNLIAIFLFGAGSIASAVPIFYDILGIVGNVQLSVILFFYSIALFYIPSLAMVLGSYFVLFKLGEDNTRNSLNLLENKVLESFGLLKIEEETLN